MKRILIIARKRSTKKLLKEGTNGRKSYNVSLSHLFAPKKGSTLQMRREV